MKILFAGNKARGIHCLHAVKNKHKIVGVIGIKKTNQPNDFIKEAIQLGFDTFQPEDINNLNFIKKIQNYKPDICVLAGYGSIVKSNYITVAKHGCINLHAGKLPKYRGSSPMNWALINGEKKFTISIIQVAPGVDTGDILMEKTFQINISDTIVELHKIANNQFPPLLLDVLDNIKNGSIEPKKQDCQKTSYYPLRFPDDGFVLFDQMIAEEIHNRIRALTSPYPGVFTYYKNKKVKLLKSSLTKSPIFGEPGRIYRISKKMGLMVCAKDKCLWLNEVVDSNTGDNCIEIFPRYDKMATIKETAEILYANQ